MTKEFNDFITEFIEGVTAEYRRLARGTPKSNRYTLGIIQRRAVEIVGTIGRSLYKLERINANSLVRCDEYSDAGRRISDVWITV